MVEYQEVIAKTRAYIRANLDRPFTVPEMASELGLSNRYLLMIFRKVLNQSVVDFVRLERIAKAKALLEQTKISITAVAMESGFEDYPHFAKTFRRKVGTTPSAFRKKTQSGAGYALSAEPLNFEQREIWFEDNFPGNQMKPHWNPALGDWGVENGVLTGSNIESQIALLRPLPENCLIHLEARIESMPDFRFPNISFILLDAKQDLEYCHYTIATLQSAANSFHHKREGIRIGSAIRITECEWHSIALEIRENTIKIALNGQEVFFFREAIPMAYSQRCVLRLAGWHARLQFRKFSIRNLGFTAAIHPIARGDTLFSADLFKNAQDFYLRFLRAGTLTDVETMELRYKIGLCQLRSGDFVQAQTWFNKVVAVREETFWAEQARLSLLEVYWQMADIDSLLLHIPFCLKDTKTCDQARMLVQRIAEDVSERGFGAEALRIMDAWIALEQPGSHSHWSAQSFLSEILLRCRKYRRAEVALLKLQSRICEEYALLAGLNLMHLYHEWGRIDESERVRNEIESATQDSIALIRCILQRALNLRAKGKLGDALAVLRSIPERYGRTKTHFVYHAKVHSALILCCLGRMREGRETLNEIRSVHPATFAEYWYDLPFCIQENDYETAGYALRQMYKMPSHESECAEAGIKAAIMFELAGKQQEAIQCYEDVDKRFPESHVRFFGALGSALTTGDEVDADTMPYETRRRSEMFFLLGLLMEKRKEFKMAQALFRGSITEDPALRWPAYFARTKIALD